jgi:hypothetical protein
VPLESQCLASGPAIHHARRRAESCRQAVDWSALHTCIWQLVPKHGQGAVAESLLGLDRPAVAPRSPSVHISFSTLSSPVPTHTTQTTEITNPRGNGTDLRRVTSMVCRWFQTDAKGDRGECLVRVAGTVASGQPQMGTDPSDIASQSPGSHVAKA